MVTLTKKDKEYINKNKGASCSIKGLMERVTMIEKHHGKKGREIREKEMQRLGYDFDISELKKKRVMPYYLLIAFLVVEAKMFNYNEEQLRRIGREMVSVSYITKFFSRFLVSPEMMANNANKIWKKYYPGELKVTKMDKKNKRMEFEISDDYPGHPYYCRCLEGYIGGIVSLIVGIEAKCQEKECVFEEGGGDAHRFVVTW